MTNTEAIFRLTTPYDNPYQGTTKRLLFVCSAGLLRSPTGAAVGVKLGYNTRSCGSNPRYSLIPLSTNLVFWAQTIYFVNIANYNEALDNFAEVSGVPDLIKHKSVVLNIEDEYNYMDPFLVNLFENVLSK